MAKDGDQGKQRLCTLKNGAVVPFEAAGNLLLDLRSAAFIAPEPERFLTSLWRACRGEDHGSLDGVSNKLLGRYLGHDGQVDAFVQQVVLASVVWENDNLVLSPPFKRKRDIDDYLIRLPPGTRGGIIRFVNTDLLWEAERKDEEEGREARLTTGEVVVPVESAKAVMFHLDCLLNDPDDTREDKQLWAAEVADLWRFCQGADVGELRAASFRGEGLADQDGPKQVVKLVLAAAVRFRGNDVYLVSPFSEQAMRQEYAQEFRKTGIDLTVFAPESAGTRTGLNGWVDRAKRRPADDSREP